MSADKKWLYPVEGMHEYKGVICMPDTTPEILQWMENDLEFDEGDVLLCAYPASGDKWLQELVWHLHNLDKLGAEKGPIGRRVPHIDHEFMGKKQPKDFFHESKAPRVFKSRMPANILGRHLDGKVKVVYQVMDPRDTLLRYQHIYNTLGKFLKFPHIEFDDYFKLFQEKQLFEGDWFDTTLSFLPYIGKENILFLKYEDVAKDLSKTIKQLAEFFNIQISADQLEQLIHIAPYDNVTDWRAQFSPAQLEWYRSEYKKKMAGTILEKTYM